MTPFTLRSAKALAAGSLAFAVTAGGVLAADTAGKETQLSTAEQTYLQETANDNLGEMAIAYMALEKAASNDTKENAKDIIDTHTKSMKDLMALASKHDYLPQAAARHDQLRRSWSTRAASPSTSSTPPSSRSLNEAKPSNKLNGIMKELHRRRREGLRQEKTSATTRATSKSRRISPRN